MGAASINSYIQGSRVIVTATTTATHMADGTPLEDPELTTPTTWRLLVRNIAADGDLIEFLWNGSAATLPTSVNATMTNPAEGVIRFAFDVDDHGERRLYFAGTGACKCAAKGRLAVEKGDV